MKWDGKPLCPTPTGKTGTPTAQTAGTSFTIAVRAVDAHWNLISTNDAVQLVSSDAQATLPANAALSAGSGTFSLTNKTTGRQTVTASDVTHPGIGSATSAALTIQPAAASQLVIGVAPTATATARDILALRPDGVFLSNGPGDPAATGVYAVPVIKAILDRGIPVFGICLGHQMFGLAMGAKTAKLPRGHRGANHPVKDLATGKVDITSQNHGFHVLPDTLPDSAEVTHISLFDGTNEGIRLKDKPAFSVQYHPEASPGPHDSHYLFKRFVEMIETYKIRQKAA